MSGIEVDAPCCHSCFASRISFLTKRSSEALDHPQGVSPTKEGETGTRPALIP